MQDKHSSHENCCLQEPSSHLRKPSSKARGSSFYVRELLVAEESFFTQQSSFAGGIVVCRRQRSKRENCHSMHESCCLQDNRSKRENCCLREPSSFAGGIVPSARIVILYARVANYRRIILHMRIAVCGSHHSMHENCHSMRENWQLLFAGEQFQEHELRYVRIVIPSA